MDDYIKREDAIKANENYVPYQRLGEDRQLYFDRILKELPSADVEPVRHGHWTVIDTRYMRLDRRTDIMECSECGHQILRRTGEIVNYCPNCGAKMIRRRQEHE